MGDCSGNEGGYMDCTGRLFEDASSCSHIEDIYAVCGSFEMPGEVHMTGELTIDNPVEGENGAVTGLLLTWFEGFGWGTLCTTDRHGSISSN